MIFHANYNIRSLKMDTHTKSELKLTEKKLGREQELIEMLTESRLDAKLAKLPEFFQTLHQSLEILMRPGKFLDTLLNLSTTLPEHHLGVNSPSIKAYLEAFSQHYYEFCKLKETQVQVIQNKKSQIFSISFMQQLTEALLNEYLTLGFAETPLKETRIFVLQQRNCNYLAEAIKIQFHLLDSVLTTTAQEEITATQQQVATAIITDIKDRLSKINKIVSEALVTSKNTVVWQPYADALEQFQQRLQQYTPIEQALSSTALATFSSSLVKDFEQVQDAYLRALADKQNVLLTLSALASDDKAFASAHADFSNRFVEVKHALEQFIETYNQKQKEQPYLASEISLHLSAVNYMFNQTIKELSASQRRQLAASNFQVFSKTLPQETDEDIEEIKDALEKFIEKNAKLIHNNKVNPTLEDFDKALSESEQLVLTIEKLKTDDQASGKAKSFAEKQVSRVKKLQQMLKQNRQSLESAIKEDRKNAAAKIDALMEEFESDGPTPAATPQSATSTKAKKKKKKKNKKSKKRGKGSMLLSPSADSVSTTSSLHSSQLGSEEAAVISPSSKEAEATEEKIADDTPIVQSVTQSVAKPIVQLESVAEKYALARQIASTDQKRYLALLNEITRNESDNSEASCLLKAKASLLLISQLEEKAQPKTLISIYNRGIKHCLNAKNLNTLGLLYNGLLNTEYKQILTYKIGSSEHLSAMKVFDDILNQIRRTLSAIRYSANKEALTSPLRHYSQLLAKQKLKLHQHDAQRNSARIHSHTRHQQQTAPQSKPQFQPKPEPKRAAQQQIRPASHPHTRSSTEKEPEIKVQSEQQHAQLLPELQRKQAQERGKKILPRKKGQGKTSQGKINQSKAKTPFVPSVRAKEFVPQFSPPQSQPLQPQQPLMLHQHQAQPARRMPVDPTLQARTSLQIAQDVMLKTNVWQETNQHYKNAVQWALQTDDPYLTLLCQLMHCKHYIYLWSNRAALINHQGIPAAELDYTIQHIPQEIIKVEKLAFDFGFEDLYVQAFDERMQVHNLEFIMRKEILAHRRQQHVPKGPQ
jgi:hypothetical protein